MKRQPKQSRQSIPTTVLDAFAPETEYVLSVDGVMLLEEFESPFITGERCPGMRDILLAILVLTDEDAVLDAKRKGKVDDLIRGISKGRRPAEVLAQGPKITAAMNAALAPLDSGADADEKKSFLAPVGG